MNDKVRRESDLGLRSEELDLIQLVWIQLNNSSSSERNINKSHRTYGQRERGRELVSILLKYHHR